VLNTMLEEVRADLAERGIAPGLAELHADAQGLLDRAGLLSAMGRDRIFDDLEDALRAVETKDQGGPRGQEEQEGARE
jgi:sulfate permease, SulP family